MMRLPLESWMLHMAQLPERLTGQETEKTFSLPGAEKLSEFADLIGDFDEAPQSAPDAGVEYAAFGLFDGDMRGEITLTREIDFGSLTGDRAALTFEHLLGSGEILMGDRVIARFDSRETPQDALLEAFERTGMPCRLCVDVTQELLLGSVGKITLRFDETRPAGMMGAAFLAVSRDAYLSRVSIQDDARRRLMTVRARVSAIKEGKYILRVQMIPQRAGMAVPPARQTDFTLAAGGEKSAVLSMEVPAREFVPGEAYDASVMRIQLLSVIDGKKDRELLCDDVLLQCGYGADAPKAYLPLDESACLGDAGALCSFIKELNVPAAMLSAPAPDGLYRAFAREGIACVQHVSEALRPAFTRYPCLTLVDQPLSQDEIALEAAAWQMTGSVAFPRALDESLTPDELLWEASGRRLDTQDEGVRASLAWLRAVQIRLRAEAARQERYQGLLCSAAESQNEDILHAIRTAFVPVHLSALPLCGAWWTDTHFSATLEAFLPEDHGGKIRACAVLEDEDGNILASFDADCRKAGYAGVIEAQLPQRACVLTLACRLMRDGEVIEESSMPVYVGERGPLEAAF